MSGVLCARGGNILSHKRNPSYEHTIFPLLCTLSVNGEAAAVLYDACPNFQIECQPCDSVRALPYLHLACYYAHESAACNLIELGANPARQATVDRMTPLMILCNSVFRYCGVGVGECEGEIARLIKRVGGEALDSKNVNGDTALHLLAHSGDVRYLSSMLRLGADFTLSNTAGIFPAQCCPNSRVLTETFHAYFHALPVWRPGIQQSYPARIRDVIRTLLVLGWARVRDRPCDTGLGLHEATHAVSSKGVESAKEAELCQEAVSFPQSALYLLPGEIMEILFRFVSDAYLNDALFF